MKNYKEHTNYKQYKTRLHMERVNFTTSFAMTPHLHTEAHTLSTLVTVVMLEFLWFMNMGMRVPIPFILDFIRTVGTILPRIIVGFLMASYITSVFKTFATSSMFAQKMSLSAMSDFVL